MNQRRKDGMSLPNCLAPLSTRFVTVALAVKACTGLPQVERLLGRLGALWASNGLEML